MGIMEVIPCHGASSQWFAFPHSSTLRNIMLDIGYSRQYFPALTIILSCHQHFEQHDPGDEMSTKLLQNHDIQGLTCFCRYKEKFSCAHKLLFTLI